MIRRPPRSTQSRSSAASDVYKRQKGTYRRDYEGDFLCSEEAVRAMFADQRDGGTDTEVLDNMALDALNTDTIKGYRIVFEQLHQGHPWNLLENDEFLMKLRAVAKNNKGCLLYTSPSPRD